MDGPGTESAATYTIDDLLETMVALGASDLHLAVGSHPVIRLNGSLDRLDQFPRLSADDTQRLLYRILSTEQQKHLEINRQIDVSYSCLLYTSDAADERSSVDLGGRRIIKK